MNKATLHKNLYVRIALRNDTKLGKIPAVSLTPIKSCSNCAECQKYCYALKAYRQYKDTKIAWDTNFDIAKYNIRLFNEDIRKFLKAYNPKFFRLHVSGDFIDNDYIRMWINIIKDYPDTQFLAYTKIYDSGMFSDLPDNFKLYYSVEPNSELPKEIPNGVQLAFLSTDKRITNSFNCPSTLQTRRDKKEHRILCDECQLCFKSNKNVVFKLH